MIFTRKETSMSHSVTKQLSKIYRTLDTSRNGVSVLSLCLHASAFTFLFDTKHLFPFCLIRDPFSLHDTLIPRVRKLALPRYYRSDEKRLSGINY